jgi:hypothetical protein
MRVVTSIGLPHAAGNTDGIIVRMPAMSPDGPIGSSGPMNLELPLVVGGLAVGIIVRSTGMGMGE